MKKMKEFKEIKNFVLNRAKELDACKHEYKKALQATNYLDLIAVIRNNKSWIVQKNFLDEDTCQKYFGVSLLQIFNTGHNNKGNHNNGNNNAGNGNNGNNNVGNGNNGDYNIGNYNKGDYNKGDFNNSHSNIGNSNNGNYNIGDCNNSHSNIGNGNNGNNNVGNYNKGNYNKGDFNKGDENLGNCNIGNSNIGRNNFGNYNQGDCNTGDYNKSDYHDGCFNNKITNTFTVFNKPSTKKDWENATKPIFFTKLKLTKWIGLRKMTEEERKDNPKAVIQKGFLKVYDYKEVWENAFKESTGALQNIDTDIKLLKKLPNWDADIFKDITGIEIK